MPTYRAPIRDMQFVINELAGLQSLAALPGYEEATPELAEAVLEAAAKLASEVLAPLNQLGDERGASLTKEGAGPADGYRAAHPQFNDNSSEGPRGRSHYARKGAPGR